MATKRAKRRIRANRVDCIDCGIGVKCDEDGCCLGCGRAVVIVRRGVPDYQHVKAGLDHAEWEAEQYRIRLAEATARRPSPTENTGGGER